MDNIIIRKAVKSDAQALINYINTIAGESDFLTFGVGELMVSKEQEEAFIESIDSRENALLIIAEIDGKIVGNLNFSGGARKRILHTGEFGMSVLKNYWRKGIGEQLLTYLIDWSKNTGIIRKLNLRVRTDNISGICLYKKLGFKEEGIVTRDFEINNEFYDSILMGLEIN